MMKRGTKFQLSRQKGPTGCLAIFAPVLIMQVCLRVGLHNMASLLEEQLLPPTQFANHVDGYEAKEFTECDSLLECQDCQCELTLYYTWDVKRYFCENCGLEMNPTGTSIAESEIQ